MIRKLCFTWVLLLVLLSVPVACTVEEDDTVGSIELQEQVNRIDAKSAPWGVFEACWMVDGQRVAECQLQAGEEFRVDLPANYLISQVVHDYSFSPGGSDEFHAISYNSNQDLDIQLSGYTGGNAKAFYYSIRAKDYSIDFRRNGNTWHCQVALTPDQSVALFDTATMQWVAMLNVDSLVVKNENDEVKAKREYAEPLQLRLQTLKKY